SNNDKFRLTIWKALPVIDEAIDEAVNRGLMPKNWLNISYFDSRYWQDATLAERHSTVGVINAYCERQLDIVFGFADSYGLATVSKVSAGFFTNGIPVMTTAGLPSMLQSRKSFPNLIRMQGSYIQMAAAMYQLIAYNEPKFNNETGVEEKTNSLNYLRMLFMYHDKRRAVNKPKVEEKKEATIDEMFSSHCYFSLYAIKNYFTDKSPTFKNEWSINTPSMPFDEEEQMNRKGYEEMLKEASEVSNG
ncbi:hypothetical protein PENTCL1PPCAC_20579, partial [Pristionchus entomophagus]